MFPFIEFLFSIWVFFYFDFDDAIAHLLLQVCGIVMAFDFPTM